MTRDEKWTAAAGILAAAGAGAGLMYLFDPQRGVARRNRIRDQAVSTARQGGIQLQKNFKDVANRAEGLFADVRHQFDCNQTVDDTVLTARIRSRLGHVAQHPHAVEVTVSEGHVLLFGHVFSDEAPAVVKEVEGVPGVTSVENRMIVHEKAAGLPKPHPGNGHPRKGLLVPALLGIGSGVIAALQARVAR